MISRKIRYVLVYNGALPEKIPKGTGADLQPILGARTQVGQDPREFSGVQNEATDHRHHLNLKTDRS